ncbi:LysR family transcriptional regulator [Paraburkholderia metrosideri]|jgi:DNA-binding transcriptional LysR family regulator|uniref:HTH-type transcriptional regulator DmlR n=1 Tax=Paraburkholderia metrosideri TaxID=580937 RepID=A0ABM8NJW5_9BURK|nr:LysR family transcriptional regulator [Paraburkholderia metrosideri]CAD6529153.1 HTH-type transcriptional regulator DmlR [Paraburkholderia metrosideri]
MDKFYNMSVFARVVEMGSFLAVANHLDSTVENVSKAVSTLEETLNTRLLQRSARQISVTDAGRRFYEHCTEILVDLEHAEAEARDAMPEPHGRLRVHSVPGLGRTHITEAVLAYRKEFPDVTVDLSLSQRLPNLLEDQLDLSIVVARTLPDSAYVSQKIGASQCVLVASPEYLAERPAPTRPEELADHNCVLLATVDYAPDEWHLQSASESVTFRPTGPHFGVNDMEAMSVALHAGAGIGLLAGFSAIDALRAGTLIRVLPEFHTYARNVYAVYLSRQLVDAKIKHFVETLKAHVGAKLDAYARELHIHAVE